MNFQKMPTIEPAQHYIEACFKAGNLTAKSRREDLKNHYSSSLNKIDAQRFSAMSDALKSKFELIIAAFPSFDNLPEFYSALAKAYFDVREIKKHLAALNWCMKQATVVRKAHCQRIMRARTKEEAAAVKGSFYGRLSSIIKQIAPNLAGLEKARRMLRDFPDIKEDCFTICLAGFPSVGKSTLLSKITPSKPEIAAYDFTTKKLNIGYFSYRHRPIQVIDVPGTLHRENMNSIELQAHLALKYLAAFVVAIYDPVSTKYSAETQNKLIKSLEEYDKEFIIFISKTDLLSKEQLAEVLEQFPGALYEPDALKKEIARRAISS